MRTKKYLLAVVPLMLAACSSSDTVAEAEVPDTPYGITPLNLLVTNSPIAMTRAEQDIQETEFDLNETVDIFLYDAHTGSEEKSVYGADNTAVKYVKVANPTTSLSTSGNLTPVVSVGLPTAYFWPKKMHPLGIYGIYPSDILNGSDALKHGDTNVKFTVQADQTANTAYKQSDLMFGQPSGIYVNGAEQNLATITAAGTAFTPITQQEGQGTVKLTFRHMLSKVMVNVRATDLSTTITQDMIDYTGTTDTKYARVSIINTIPSATFSVGKYGTTVTTDAVGDIIAGRGGSTVITESTVDVTYHTSVACVVVPQTVAKGTAFIKIELIDATSGTPTVTDTFYYSVPNGAGDSALTLQPGYVYTYNIRVNKADLTVTSTISAWDNTTPAVTDYGEQQ